MVLVSLLRVPIHVLLLFFLINVLLYADFKNAICFWRSHIFLSYKNVLDSE